MSHKFVPHVGTIPDDWNLPKTVSVPFVRRLIGEGIPPKFIAKLFITLENTESRETKWKKYIQKQLPV